MNINGLRVGAEKFSPELRERIKLVLSEMRRVIQLPNEAKADQRFGGNTMETFRGSRFNSDDHVLWLLESGATEEEVRNGINAACFAGLLAAAKSDHWYKYEKDWGNEHEGEVEDCEIENEE